MDEPIVSRKRRAKRRIQTGATYSLWTALYLIPASGEARWMCRCACGTERSVKEQPLATGKTLSCGCLTNKQRTDRHQNHDKICVGCGGKIANRSGTRHKYCTRECYVEHRYPRHANKDKHPMFKTWCGMMNRCYRSLDIGYHRYGGRGITVCAEWHNFDAFESWALAQPREAAMTLDRKDNDLGYSPDNCHFATIKQQMRNRHANLIVEIFGERKTAADWADDPRCAVNYGAFAARIKRGTVPAVALTTPLLPNLGAHTTKLARQ